MDVDAVAADLDAALRDAGTAARAWKEKQYLKSDLEFYGATLPAMRQLVKRFAADQPDLERGDLLALVRALWDEPVHERRVVAVLLLERFEVLLEPVDLDRIGQLLRESKTWALVDNLATSVAGPLLDRTPSADEVLDAWVADDDFWIRRSALLAHLGPLRAGQGDFQRFCRYADEMLEEKEFFIRKAIGWVLRDTARKRPHLVYEWIAPRTHRASGVTVREVVKRLPEDRAAEVLGAYRAGRPVSS